MLQINVESQNHNCCTVSRFIAELNCEGFVSNGFSEGFGGTVVRTKYVSGVGNDLWVFQQ